MKKFLLQNFMLNINNQVQTSKNVCFEYECMDFYKEVI